MGIERFMQGYKSAWETQDEHAFCALFTEEGVYRNTPFDEQRGHAKRAQYWQRTKLQRDIRLTYEILASAERSGVAHWRTTYQVGSEELFRLWAAASGTNLIARKPGDPLPRLTLDGIIVAEFEGDGLCRECRLWWHSVAQA